MENILRFPWKYELFSLDLYIKIKNMELLIDQVFVRVLKGRMHKLASEVVFTTVEAACADIDESVVEVISLSYFLEETSEQAFERGVAAEQMCPILI